jgi:hypothetical protein
MKYNLTTKEIFTNDGQFIKKMNCPEKADWDTMDKTDNDLKRMCNICNKSVIDTEFLSDDEVLYLAEKDPTICLRIISYLNLNY